MLRKFRRWRRLSVRAKFGLVIAAFIASLSFIQMAAGWLSGETNGSISKTMTKVRDFLERMQIIRFTETQPWISYCGMTVFVFSVVVLIYDWLASRHNSRLVSAGTPAIGNPSDRPHLTALAETLARASERSIGDLAEMHLRERAEAKKQKSSTALTDTQTTQNLNPPSVSPASQSDSAPLDIPRIRAAVEYCTAPVLAFHELFAKDRKSVV